MATKSITQLAKIHRRAIRRGRIAEKIAAAATVGSITWRVAVGMTHALRSTKIGVEIEAARRINNPDSRAAAKARAAQAAVEAPCPA